MGNRMDARTLLNKICDEADKDAVINLEFPGLCGNSDIGRKSCPGHGHISLSVAKETVVDLAFKETHSAILMTVPKTLLDNIMNLKGGN